MDKQAVIDILASQLYGFSVDTIEDCVYVAEILYGAGYRKISENEVVLTRKEYQKYLAFKIIEPQVRGCLDRERELEKRLETISKKTATITEQGQADWLDGYKVGFRDGVVALRTQTVEKIDEICKKLTEGGGQ